MTISPIGAYQFPQLHDDSHRLFAPQRAAWVPGWPLAPATWATRRHCCWNRPLRET